MPVFAGGIALALLSGCKTPTPVAAALSASYQPDNVYLAAHQLPGDVKRIAVLPLACDSRQTDLSEGREALAPVLTDELIKTKKFEVTVVSAREVWRLTGREEWTGNEVLPAGFLDSLQKQYGCDAVLFCELTGFRPYPPLSVGWRFKLVDARRKTTLWAGDEEFDAGNPSVMAAAMRYQEREQRQPGDESTDWMAVNSPRWFGQYTIDSLLGTLPGR